MKILVAIESSKNAKGLASTTLRWAGRSGFNTRIFIPDETQIAEYADAIFDANYKWYLSLPITVLVHDKKPEKFAKEEGFDLVLYLSDDIRKWNPKLILDENVVHYAADVGIARAKFSRDSNKQEEVFANGAIMRRV